jgi:CBS domain containing-hemolysin-like protein
MYIFILIFAAILLAAFFTGVESALFRSAGSKSSAPVKPKAAGYELARLMAANPQRYIAAIRLGKHITAALATIALYMYFSGILSELTSSEIPVLLLSLAFSIIIIFTLTQLIPFALARVFPESTLKFLAAPAMFFFLLLYPITRIVQLFTGVFSSSANSADEIYTRTDIEDNPVAADTEKDADPGRLNLTIFRNVLDLSSVKLREIMVPRTEIEAVPASTSFSELREKFILTRFSRILVYEDSIDDIKGYFEVKDIFRNADNIMSLLRKISIVPETMQASNLLKMFVEEKHSIALVVDEFGGTSGMITIEDLLEEIVGDIEDEHDSRDLVERVVKQNEYIFSGRLEIDYLNEKYDLNLPEGTDYETLAGMILFYHGSLPGNNEIIPIGNIVVKILRVSATKLELVNLKVE